MIRSLNSTERVRSFEKVGKNTWHSFTELIQIYIDLDLENFFVLLRFVWSLDAGPWQPADEEVDQDV